MIRVYADDVMVYSAFLDDYTLEKLECTVSVDKAGTAEIVMPAGHPAYSAFTAYRTIVTIYQDDELLFRGRPLSTTDDLSNTRTVTCEGERNFLRDAVMPPYLYQSSPTAIFADVIRRYNEQVEAFKEFRVGAITAKDPNDYQYIKCEEASQVSDVIDKLVEYVGGYIVFTTAPDGQRVINWYGSLDDECDQVIEFGENLLDFSRSGANDDLATRIYPYGAKDEVTGERLTIKAVNGGKEYVQDDEAVALRGVIAKPVYWDDVTLAKNLKKKAEKYLETSKLIVTTLELSVLDLSTAGYDVEALTVGKNVRVRSVPHAVNDKFLLSERTYNLLNAAEDSIVLGKEIATMTRADVAGDKRALAQLQRTTQNLQTATKDRIVYATSATEGGYDAPDGSGGAEVVVFQAVIPATGWGRQPMAEEATGAEYYMYYIDVEVPGIFGSDTPIIDVAPESVDEFTRSAIESVQKDWAKITRVSTGDGGITLTAFEELSADLPIKIMCVR